MRASVKAGDRRSAWIHRATIALAFGLAMLGGAAAQETPELGRGKQVFDRWCAPCHAPGPRHPGTQALEVLYKGQKPGALEERDDLTAPVTAAFVRNGVSVMPPFRKTEITDADLAALGAYLAR
jgi:(+)-pinoresinol hydroxylase